MPSPCFEPDGVMSGFGAARAAVAEAAGKGKAAVATATIEGS